jgi:single-strand DNA-binding protein
LWRKLAEIVERYVHKGDKIYIEGRIHYASYDDKHGKRQYYTEIWADNMELLTPRQTTATGSVPSATTVPNATVSTTAASDQEDEKLPF